VDAGNIIYIVAVIIYFIYSALKKDKTNIPEPHSTDEIPETRRPVSFEDLLKEIRQSQHEREADYENSGQGDIVEERRDHQRNPYVPMEAETRPVVTPMKESKPMTKKASAYDQYQGEMGEKLFPKHRKLDDQVSIDEPISRLNIPELEEVNNPIKSEHYYSKLLKDPQTVKDAVILGEILNRKHF
jgi:hypothetical protein